MRPDYREDLAYIHHVGFGSFARGAARGVLGMLEEAGIRDGLVVDLGCGSGILAGQLRGAGYEVLGVDSSPPMIELARTVSSKVLFECASLYDVAIPPCAAVTALGEVLNYIPAGMEALPPLAHLFRRISRALRPGGLLVFDVFVRGSGKPMIYRSCSAGEDWAVLVDVKEEPEERSLTRNITAFRKAGETYRRSEEIHRVRILDRREIEAELRRAGFSVRVSPRYGKIELAPRRLAFRARKRRGLEGKIRR